MSVESCLYRGTVVHRRFAPVPHELRRPATYLLLDIDRLDELARRLRLFGHGRGGLFTVRDRDVGPSGEDPLPQRLRALLRQAGLGAADGRIMMLCLPRVLGYVFNPLTTYYCHDGQGALRAMVCEVSNTFGERRHYVIEAGDGAGEAWRQNCRKTLYVSPFNEIDGRYDFTFMAPEEKLRLTVTLSRGNERILSAYVAGNRRELSDREILSAFLSRPFLTYAVTAGIHWEALKLWRKGLRIQPRPKREPPSSHVPAAAPDTRR